MRILKSIGLAFYLIGGAALLILTLPQTGWKVMTVATSSMSPHIPVGSLVLIHKVPPSQLKVGDVVTYINPANPKQTITHRIISTYKQANIPGLITKGDANKSADKPILTGNVVGKSVGSLAGAGKFARWLQRPVGFGLLIILPALLIIIDELRRLIGVFREHDKLSYMDGRSTATRPVAKNSFSHTRPAAVTAKPELPKSRKKGMDGLIAKAVIVILLPILFIGVAHAALSSQARLTGNTLTVESLNHVIIYRVTPGTAIANPCANGSAEATSISNTGPGSNNSATSTTNCSITSNSSTNISVDNNSSQTATSGQASQAGSTNGGSSSSGSVSNSNSTSTSITINNASSNSNPGLIELYNPTNQVINLAGWRITDNSGESRSITSGSIAAQSFRTITSADLGGQDIGNGLSMNGDRIILQSPSTAVVDMLSWGTDTSQLNPAAPAITPGKSLQRKSIFLDKDSATDWIITP